MDTLLEIALVWNVEKGSGGPTCGLAPVNQEISMKRLLLASLPVICLSVSCAETSSSDPPIGSGSSALSAAQCDYFEEGGRVTICHATGGAISGWRGGGCWPSS